MNLRQAAEMALECLNYHWDNPDHEIKDWPYVLEAKKALRQALAEEEPWVKTYCGGKPNYTTPVDTANMSQECVDETVKRKHEPMASVPEKPDTWVGLTDEEKYDVLEGATGDGGRVYYDTLFRSYEAKLKEKNSCG